MPSVLHDSQLTPEQRAIVELRPDRHHLVMGPPGSGKTQILLHRARWLRQTYKTPPDPGITAAGAAGGVLLSEGGFYLAGKASDNAYTTGYEKGRSDAVRQQYWIQVLDVLLDAHGYGLINFLVGRGQCRSEEHTSELQ